MTVPTYSTSNDYIPRDDTTEAMRIKAFGGATGYGEAIFEEDPELAEALSEMIANGQVDLGEGVVN